MTPRVVVGISGASGAAIGVRVVERLVEIGAEVHLVVSHAAEATLCHEVGPDAIVHIKGLVPFVHDIAGIGDSIASGSFATAGMIVAPCSMRTLAALAHGLADDLLIRAADVHLKERRRLVLVARETPLHLGHLRNMVAVTELGAIVAPPVPAFYRRPDSIAEMVDMIAARSIDLLGLQPPSAASEWTGLPRS
jgi:4-hydroxy-3-polyprenylbenzoate decarboxylase